MADNNDDYKTTATKEEEETATPQEQAQAQAQAQAQPQEEQERHACEIQVTFPTNLLAEQAMKVLQVDAEPSDRVTKSFRLHEETNENETDVSMIVRLESKELKMLRVAVSSFYDYLTVVLKTMQEFDTTVMMDTSSS